MYGKIKIREQKSKPSFDSPRFTIEIEQSRLPDQQIQNNYEMLSKLIGDSDVVISLDSSLMNLANKQRMPLIHKFLETIRGMDLEYRCLKSTGHSSKSILSMLFGAKDTEEQEIIAYIPNKIWTDGSLQKTLPFYGAKYFVTKNASTGPVLLDDMQKMMDDEKLEYFRFIIFNSISISSTGIFSKYLSLSELEEMLKP